MVLCKNRLVIANTGSDSLSIIDLSNLKNTQTLFLGPLVKNLKSKNVYINGNNIGPHSITLGKEGHILYTINSYHNSIFKLDLNQMTIEDVVFVGSSPSHMERYNGLLYVTNSDSNSISVIDENEFSLISNIAVGEKPHDIEIDKIRKKIYVANNDGHSLHIIGLEDLIERELRLNCNPHHLSLSDNELYILSAQDNGILKSSIMMVDLNKEEVIKEITLNGTIMDMVVVQCQKSLYVSNVEDGNLYKIDISKGQIIDMYHIGGMPNALLWNKKGWLVITNALENNISLFDIKKGRVVDTIKVGEEPNGGLFIE